ncbi:NADP-dependent glyceraldehyde-3-phosphate dehydrogenase [Hibiscus syriacus]|uniref:NADP-dependent glyceraldehyde-3-phosphate dehydrogenase n=1 Tax=Hibiscus syriacus TaxID=106335 RepID=A0A6A3C6D8_HIBSY|nr:NADP-dependent glyceraldehyde-3-phosphate dehydrogenase [Hibiscus syriacus]
MRTNTRHSLPHLSPQSASLVSLLPAVGVSKSKKTDVLEGGVYKYYADGEWKQSSSGKSVAIINPITRKTQYKRAELLHKAAAIIKEHKAPIAECLAKEIAKPAKDDSTEVVRSGDLVPYIAEEGIRILVNLAVPKIAPALIAGNSLVLKPPTRGAVSALHMWPSRLTAGVVGLVAFFAQNLALGLLCRRHFSCRRCEVVGVIDHRPNPFSSVQALPLAVICAWGLPPTLVLLEPVQVDRTGLNQSESTRTEPNQPEPV